MKIKEIDQFILECQSKNEKINYENFIRYKSLDIPKDVFEAYIKYLNINENDEVITLLEFQKIKSFINYLINESNMKDSEYDELDEEDEDNWDDEKYDEDEIEEEEVEGEEEEEEENEEGKEEEEENKDNKEIAEDLIEKILSFNLDSLNEGLGVDLKAVITSPINFIKIKNNLAKWAKAKLDLAVVEMDYIRKKEVSKNKDLTDIEKEKLKAAFNAKKEALKGKMSAIEDRMEELATDKVLKTIVRLGKAKASLEANKKLLKIAQQEENDALKIRLQKEIENEQETITTLNNQLKKYISDKKKEKEKKETKKEEEEKEKEIKKE